jgi:ABC-type transport system involved in multi-copper enzyme maturation permease subunit
MTRIVAIALNTFREAIRNKVLYILLLFGIAVIASALLLGQMSLHEESRITRDVGLGGMLLFGVLIGIFVGVNLVYKELDRKTVFALIPKPIHRWELILGKYAGMLLTLAVLVAIMAAVLFSVIAVQDLATEHPSNPLPVVRAIVLTFGELAVVTAVAVLFSSFSTPLLSGAFTLGMFIVGHFTPELRELISHLGSAGARALFYGALRLFPDLHLFFVSGDMIDGRYVSVHNAYVDWTYVLVTSSYGVAYSACALALAMLLFSRRDFV